MKTDDPIQQKIDDMKKRSNRRPKKSAKSVVCEKKPVLLTMKKAASHLGIGFKTLFRILRENGDFVKTDGSCLPKTELIEKGYFRNEFNNFKRGKMPVRYIQTFVTANGISFLAEIIEKNKKEDQK